MGNIRCAPAGDNEYVFIREVDNSELIRLRFPTRFTKEQKIEAAEQLTRFAIALLEAK